MATAGGSRLAGTLFVYGLVTALLSVTGPAAGFEMEVEIVRKQYIQPLGLNECTYGPSFWCQNITNAAGCKAVKHCIQTTWETHTYPEDNDDICTICKNMVKEARDTLTSNATLDELKQVFYGSCQLLPLKVIKTECKKLADDFIPELVDTLASEMDPNVVCTVSGLCNNARIDKLLLENKEKVQPKISGEHDTCEKCAIAMNKGESLVEEMSKNDVINKILMMCGELSSYSDACSSIVLTYHNEIYNAVKNGFTKRNVCLLSGMCSEAFHPHTDGYEKSRNALMGVEISNAGERGRIKVQKPNEISDDLTCEFCEAMVKHLRDILVSNTTEDQFLDVLNGLCKQTKSFSAECLSIVEEHYTRIYKFLINELDGSVLCSIVGICSKHFDTRHDLNYFVPMFPILPVDFIQMQEDMNSESASSLAVKKEQNNLKPMLVVDELPPKVLDIKPIKKSPIIDLFYKEMHVVVKDVDLPKDKTLCFLCQSVLNYVQQELTNPQSEEEIRIALEKSCTVVPASFEQQCQQFVDQYGDAFISLIVQEVDPSIVCPELKLCPAIDLSVTSKQVGLSLNHCPMCIIFMSTLESEITNTDTEKVIKIKLEKLCTKLPSKWKAECTDFVSNKFQSILDMLVAKVKPEEICVMLEICDPKTLHENDLETNMVASSGQVTVVFPGYDVGQLVANNYKMLEEPKVPTPFCLICTVVMKYLNSEIKDKSNEEEIQHVLDSMCSILPNVEENECQTFVDTNYQYIIKAIKIGTDPGVACMTLMVCSTEKVDKSSVVPLEKVTIPGIEEFDVSDECTACETFVTVFGDRLNNDTFKIDDIDLAELCFEIDAVYKDQADDMMLSFLEYVCKSKPVNVHEMVKNIIELVRPDCFQKCEHKSSEMKFHPKCSICKDIINNIKQKIKKSPFETDLEIKLELLCHYLPNKKACINFVDKYTNKLLNILIGDVNEESVCKEIGYC